jgi:hypothetical protein
MISATENLNLGKMAHRKVRAADFNFALDVAHRTLAPLPSQQPFDWCVENVIFDDSEVKGPFNPTGRHYLEDILNDTNADDCTEQYVIMATGSAKTLALMGRHLWNLVHKPCRSLMVMPATKGEGGSETYVTSRFIPAIKATRATAALMPDSQERLFMNSKKIRLNGSHYGYVGANSKSQIASNRCGNIDMDEMDKYPGTLGSEAGTKSLVMERVEGVLDYKVFGNTTPTVETGTGWKSLLRSDFRRRFLPCPRCNRDYRHRALLQKHHVSDANLKGWVTLTWFDPYYVLPDKFESGIVIPRAVMDWDKKEAERQDGSIDEGRVIASARLTCGHCGGHILDEDKLWMDKHGVWIPTRASHGIKGYHLSGLYTPPLVSRDYNEKHKSRLAGRALKFLGATEDGEGMKGFINSTLAEVDVSQEHAGEKFEIHSHHKCGSDHWLTILSVDNQQNFPYRWFIARRYLAAILRPLRTPDQQKEFQAQLDPAARAAVATLLHDTKAEPENILCPHRILAHLQRSDHWPRLGEWLIGNKLIGKNLSQFFQVEFQTDLMRLIEFIARQKELNLKLGKPGDSELLEAGFGDLWEEIDEVQRRWHIHNVNVLVDAKWNTAEVSAECFRRCPERLPNGGNGFCHYHPYLKKYLETSDRNQWNFARAGWTPVFGFESSKTWKDPRGISFPYTTRPEDMLDDPFKGQHNSNRFHHHVFKFNAQWALSELARIRKRNRFSVAQDCRWTPEENQNRGGIMRPEEYQKHLRGYYWDERKQIWDAPGKHGGSQSRRHPNHLYDCEKNAIAWIASKGILRIDPTANK